MLRHWSKLLTRDCTVIDIGKYTVYPIHRVGFTSLMSEAVKIYTNTQISSLTHIDVLIRDPEARFVSGVNEYCRQNKLDIRGVYKKIKHEYFLDSHFAPQYIWLMNLYRFYRGEITIRPFNFISNITQVHLRKDEPFIEVKPIKKFTQVDADIIKNTTVQRRFHIKDIIEEYKRALS
jgi:hypothetical protein